MDTILVISFYNPEFALVTAARPEKHQRTRMRRSNIKAEAYHKYVENQDRKTVAAEMFFGPLKYIFE
jgi:hypothetical protein